MSQLTPDIADQLLARWRENLNDAAGALTSAFGAKFEVESPENARPLDPTDLPESLAGDGLICSLAVGEAGMLLLLPATVGLLPSWAERPDDTQRGRLDSLAQGLAGLLLPEGIDTDLAKAHWVDELAAAIAAAKPGENCQLVTGKLSCNDRAGELIALWPVTQLAAATASSNSQSPTPSTTPPTGEGFDRLPSYGRSLLRIEVPVTVTLAQTRQPLKDVLDLAPGSILQFNKSCEEMLDLEVAGHHIAEGEAVKVGDKFGLRITSIVLPEERFHAARK